MIFFSRRARRVRREDPKKNIQQEMIFYSKKIFSFSVSPVSSSEAGVRKVFVFRGGRRAWAQ
jgi:hypothetical protein